MSRGQGNDLITSAVEKCPAKNKKRAWLTLRDCGEGRFEVGIVVHAQRQKAKPHHASGLVELSWFGCRLRATSGLISSAISVSLRNQAHASALAASRLGQQDLL